MFRLLLNPVSELQQMIDFMDRATTARWSEPLANRTDTDIIHTLPVDIWQKENVCYIRAAVPGVKPENLDIQVQDGVLTIAGEMRHEAVTDEKANFWRREYMSGRFLRSIRLPELSVTEQIEASFEDGFVTISVPLAVQTPKSLKVPIKSAAGSQPVLEASTETKTKEHAGSKN